MSIKNILIGMLAIIFYIGLAGTVFAGDSNEPYASLTDSDDIDSSGSLSAYVNSEVIDSNAPLYSYVDSDVIDSRGTANPGGTCSVHF